MTPWGRPTSGKWAPPDELPEDDLQSPKRQRVDQRQPPPTPWAAIRLFSQMFVANAGDGHA
jgi:hypothetical protein